MTTVGFLLFSGMVPVLDAYGTNHRAHVFYVRNGFRVVGHHFNKHAAHQARLLGEATGRGSTGGVSS